MCPRNVPARIEAVCTEVTLDVAVHYAEPSDDKTSPTQRLIDASIRLPHPAEQGWLATVECWFDDGKRLSSLSLYGNFLAAETARIDVPSGADRVWLSPPAPGQEDGPAGAAEVTLDRDGRAVKLWFGERGRVEWFALADGLHIALDGCGVFAGLIVADVEWRSMDAD